MVSTFCAVIFYLLSPVPLTFARRLKGADYLSPESLYEYRLSICIDCYVLSFPQILKQSPCF